MTDITPQLITLIDSIFSETEINEQCELIIDNVEIKLTVKIQDNREYSYSYENGNQQTGGSVYHSIIDESEIDVIWDDNKIENYLNY